jgi:hypothetical protein
LGLKSLNSLQHLENGRLLASAGSGHWVWDPETGRQPVALGSSATTPPVLQVWPYNSSQDVGGAIQFPDTAVGAQSQLLFIVVNTGSTGLSLATLRIPPGGAFSVFGHDALPWPLTSDGGFVAFGIQFAPTAPGAQSGTLSVSAVTADGSQEYDRSITVQGNGTGSATPLQPKLVMADTSPGSNESVIVSVTFANNATAAATGLLTLEFTPANASLPTDPGIYLDGNEQQTLVQPFVVPAGSNTAQFGSDSSVTLHTGTTAGSFVLKAMAGSLSDQASFNIKPAAPAITSTALTMASDSAEVVLQGFDNSHAVTGLSFTFYTASGSEVTPGQIDVNVSNAFSQYYASNQQIGGSFQVTATFPVTGDISKVASVGVTITNPSGATSTNGTVSQ